jgi:hypothetical protein
MFNIITILIINFVLSFLIKNSKRRIFIFFTMKILLYHDFSIFNIVLFLSEGVLLIVICYLSERIENKFLKIINFFQDCTSYELFGLFSDIIYYPTSLNRIFLFFSFLVDFCTIKNLFEVSIIEFLFPNNQILITEYMSEHPMTLVVNTAIRKLVTKNFFKNIENKKNFKKNSITLRFQEIFLNVNSSFFLFLVILLNCFLQLVEIETYTAIGYYYDECEFSVLTDKFSYIPDGADILTFTQIEQKFELILVLFIILFISAIVNIRLYLIQKNGNN